MTTFLHQDLALPCTEYGYCGYRLPTFLCPATTILPCRDSRILLGRFPRVNLQRRITQYCEYFMNADMVKIVYLSYCIQRNATRMVTIIIMIVITVLFFVLSTHNFTVYLVLFDYPENNENQCMYNLFLY